jgi:O-antigen/teichoic acid export membrane protein
MAAMAPEFVRVVLGAKWQASVLPLQVFCISGLVRALRIVGVTTRNAIGRPEVTNYSLLAQMVVTFALLFPLTYQMGLFGASLAVLIAYVLISVVLLFVDREMFNIALADFLTSVKDPLFGSLLMVLCISVERIFLSGIGEIQLLLIFSVTGGLCYSGYVLWSLGLRSYSHLGQAFRTRFIIKNL